MKRTIIFISALLLSAGLSLQAQNLSDLRISEVVATNENGLLDEYGERHGWIELFNTSSGTVKFGGCYLTDDPSDLKKYHVPTTDSKTSAGPRQSVVFHASGKPYQGSFHTSFTIANGSTVYLVSNDGKTVIDSLSVPSDLPADWSVVKIPAGIKKIDMETSICQNPTPGSYNGDVDAKTNSEIMKEKDPYGLVLTLIAVFVVFLSLFVLSIIFNLVGKASMKAAGKPKEKKAKKAKKGKAPSGGMTPEVAAAISLALRQEFGGEVYAAIALALDDYLGTSAHDLESYVITIRPSASSQWADKSQNFRRLPR
ncbi:MAG: OadG family transporter subunit [Candidatus Cryptobacteroides sp.]